MWQAILSWFGGPVLSAAIDAYKAKLAAGTSEATLAQQLGLRELEVQQAELQAQAQLRTAEIGHPWEPDKLMAYVVAIYFAKIVLFDKVLALGVTDPLTGWSAITATTIVGAYFGRRTFENVARIWRR